MSSQEFSDLKDNRGSFISRLKSFDFGNFFNDNKVPISLFLIGLILIGSGLVLFKNDYFSGSPKVEVLEDSTELQNNIKEIVVEVAGAVEKPGVFKIPSGSRIEDLLVVAGGLSVSADRNWIEKTLNRASVLKDGQKVYIPEVDSGIQNSNKQTLGESASNNGDIRIDQEGQGSGSTNLVNINAASKKDLEGLWGIGPVTAQNIIEQRPYSSLEELLSKKILKQNVYDRNKNLMSVY